MTKALLLSLLALPLFAEDQPQSFPENCIWMIKYGDIHGHFHPSAQQAIVALGLTKSPAHIDLIGDVLTNHPNDHMRYAAAKALYWIHHQDCVPYLQGSLADSYRHTRNVSVHALESITGEIVPVPQVYTLEELQEKKKALEDQLRKVTEILEERALTEEEAVADKVAGGEQTATEVDEGEQTADGETVAEEVTEE